jgi:hypothetical protein
MKNEQHLFFKLKLVKVSIYFFLVLAALPESFVQKCLASLTLLLNVRLLLNPINSSAAHDRAVFLLLSCFGS